MSSVTETLNLLGQRFVDFALPMLVQSSLLVAFLMVLDLIIRKRVRAVVRYGIWMLVLIKLVLPPSFASPTGLGYWLTLKQPDKPIVAPVPIQVTVSYSEALMVEMGHEADAYPITLLEVVKLTFTRSLLSLGLLGIMESKSALKEPIDRLMDFRPPRKAGFTFTPALCVLALGALAVPMGKAPPPVAVATNLVYREYQIDLLTFARNLAKRGGLSEVQAPVSGAGLDIPKQSSRATDETLARSKDKVPVLGDLPLAEAPRSNTVSATGTEAIATNLYVETFEVDTNTFLARLRGQTRLSETSTREEQQEAVRKLLSDAGIELKSPEGMFYNNGASITILATLEKLEVVERVIMKLYPGALRANVNPCNPWLNFNLLLSAFIANSRTQLIEIVRRLFFVFSAFFVVHFVRRLRIVDQPDLVMPKRRRRCALPAQSIFSSSGPLTFSFSHLLPVRLLT